ncbi:unnamed protein product [Brachionus calyciflorus]|uniref:SET domain-containing protein n=1 Tax=Brachionus calyciflorus TaxID=104777 RepID=A0A813M388_9BILA|nr:unnamed protein product [Brachionus calyciflorus]
MCDSELFRIEKTNYAGFGLYANRKIIRGQLIINEQPLIVYDRNKSNLTKQITDKVNKLSIEDKKLFYSLYDCYLPNSPTALGIGETNCLPLGQGSNFFGIFPTISRINHSCCPNVYHCWNNTKKVETIYALKDIEKDEEILTSYIDLYADKATRQKQLKQSFRFDCSCQLCSKSTTDSKKSDIRRKVLSQLDEEIATLAWSMPEKALIKAEQILKYLKDEDMFYLANYVGRVGYDVFQILFMNSKVNKNLGSNIQAWAQLTKDSYMTCSGNYDDCILKNQLEIYAQQH